MTKTEIPKMGYIFIRVSPRIFWRHVADKAAFQFGEGTGGLPPPGLRFLNILYWNGAILGISGSYYIYISLAFGYLYLLYKSFPIYICYTDFCGQIARDKTETIELKLGLINSYFNHS